MDAAHGKFDKAEWRRRMAAVRESLPVAERRRLSERLCSQVEDRILDPLRRRLGRPLGVCAYAAFRSEADPFPLLERCWEMGDTIFAPRILPGGEGMQLRKVEAFSNWTPGKWGVPEPDVLHTSLREDNQPIDIVLVPGLAFNVQGGRLGYGGGYYDRLFENSRINRNMDPLWIGFAFSAQVVDEPLPVEPHDLSLNGLATDAGVIWFGQEGL